MVIVIWYVNKCVIKSFGYTNQEPVLLGQRGDRVDKKHINMNCSDVIKQYNTSIYGVVLAQISVSSVMYLV